MRILLALLLMSSCAFAQVGLGGQAGVSGDPFNAPAISAVSESADATTIVLQWTTDVASNSTGRCGSEEAVDSNIAAASTSHEVVVAGLTPSTTYTCTVQSGASVSNIAATTTALASSTAITAVSLGTITEFSPINADTEFNFVSKDGTTYFGMDDANTNLSGATLNSALNLAKFTSLSPFAATLINTLPGYGWCCTISLDADGYNPKQDGVLIMADVTYMAVARILNSSATQPQYAEQFIASPDYGTTWNSLQNPSIYTTTGAQTTPVSLSVFPNTANAPTNFACSSFVIYGADDGTLGYTVANNRVDNANAYVYLVSDGAGANNGGCNYNNGSNLFLLRFPRAALASTVQVSRYAQCWVSGDGTLDSNWTNNFTLCGAALTNSGEMGLISEEYIPALNRYLMMTYYYPGNRLSTPGNCTWLVYDAPHPWGPYTLVSTITNPTLGYYNPIALQADVLAAGATGTNFRIMFTGNFTSSTTYRMYYATLTVTP